MHSNQFQATDGDSRAISRTGGPVSRFPVGHYYSPMYDTRELALERERIWPSVPRGMPDVDWRDEQQVALCRDVFGRYEHFEFCENASDDPTEYYSRNDQYPPLDAWVLAGMIRYLRPARLIEVGSGFSTLVSARANREYLGQQMTLTCIEPYPRQFLLDGVPGVSTLRVERVQDTPLNLFAELEGNDVLFVDTSHTVKTGGDVTWIFHEILPRLAPGVVVHFHDVFLPGDYPEPWVMDGWGWNENYLVRSFLSFNDAFAILWGTAYMLLHHRSLVAASFPGPALDPQRLGASLWIRREA